MSARLQRITVTDGLSLSVRLWGERGTRTPLLCLPGLVRTGGDFAHLARRHAATRLVVAPDYVGRGASERAKAWQRYAPERMLADMLDVAAALHMPRAVVIGTSLGALLAMGLSVARPGLVAGALLNDAGPEIGGAGLTFVRSFVGNEHAQPSLDAAASFLRAALPWLSLRGDAAWTEMAELTFAQGADGQWRANWDTAIARTLDRDMPRDLWPLFATLARLPAMLVRGGTSDILSAETAAAMRARFPGLAYAELPDVGHAPTLSEDGLAETVDAFIAAQP